MTNYESMTKEEIKNMTAAALERMTKNQLIFIYHSMYRLGLPAPMKEKGVA